MARRLTLHIGTPKSGTTHLQSILARGREQLASDGVLYPGAEHLPRQGFNQQPAIYALAGTSTGWADDAVRKTSQGYLHHLCEELSAYPGHALVSAESLAFFDVESARGLLSHLGYDPASVTVVITARDLGRILPSIWQQNVKNGTTQALGPYLDSVATLHDGPRTPLWTAFGLPGLVRRWSEIIDGGDRVVLVTSPGQPTSTDELWQRFAAAAAIQPDLADVPGPRLRAVDNISLTMSQTEIIRHLNTVLQADGYSRDQQQRLRSYLLDVWMNMPGPGGRRPAIPKHLHNTVRQWSRSDVAELEASGVRVVGSLADLKPQLPDRPGPSTPATMDEDTARDVLALLEHARGLAPAERVPLAVLRAVRPLQRWHAALTRIDLPHPRRRRPPGSSSPMPSIQPLAHRAAPPSDVDTAERDTGASR